MQHKNCNYWLVLFDSKFLFLKKMNSMCLFFSYHNLKYDDIYKINVHNSLLICLLTIP